MVLARGMAALLGHVSLQQFAAVAQQHLPSVLSDGGVQLATSLQKQVPYGTRVQFTAAAALFCGAWLRLVVSKAAPSLWSLLLVVPLVAFNHWLPLLFHYREELCTRCSAICLLLWLCSFKAIGLCLGRGPLAGGWSVGQTCLLYVMLIYPSQAFCVTLAYVLATFDLPIVVKYYFYALALYGFVTFLMDGPAALLISCMGLKVVPPFDKPWLAETLADFWSRRWNNTTSLTLRALVYDPVVERRLVKLQQQQQQQSGTAARTPLWLRLAGMTATFVSGLMHEVILFYVSHPGQYHAGYWFTFFQVQAPLVLVESLLFKRLAASQHRMPRLLGIAYTTSVLLTLAAFLWYPPIDTYSDIAPAVVAAINSNAAGALGWLQGLGSSVGIDSLLVHLAGISRASAAV